MMSNRLVSCIMPTANRRQFVPAAIRMFLAQDYPDKELVIFDDGDDSVADLVPRHPQLRYLRPGVRECLGVKRNLACEETRGEIILHWDDDDWYAPTRLRYQVDQLLTAGADVCGLDRVLFLDAAGRRAWEYVYPPGDPAWVYGATLCYQKAFWRRNPFPRIGAGEDTRFIFDARGARIKALPETGIFVGLIHGANTSPKQTNGARWQSKPLDVVRGVMGSDWTRYVQDPMSAITAPPARRPALVSAAFGIGDILRVTPLVRVLHRLGYDVDVLLAPDYPGAVDLLRGAPEVRRIIHYPQLRNNHGARPLPEPIATEYELAVFTTWSAPLARWIKSKQQYKFTQAKWLSGGDIASIDEIARTLGWQGPLPEPFAMRSCRDFELPPGTVALHPGCKPDWPWKRWHGFDELARLLPEVAIIGTEADLDNAQTYFGRAFEWPEHARNFAGQLSLGDTAALISQCAALVSNDSGLMHLGVALGVTTLGIFGITNPAREIIPSEKMTPITKGLACEPACRQQAWGRRDCEHHLACLKTLTAEEVAQRVQAALLPQQPVKRSRVESSEEMIRLNYYGNVSDASGYGQAARLYVHALHAAGVKVSVVDTGTRPPQTIDPLIASLIGTDSEADFNLFHGIPPYWAQTAYALRNVIAMTVWETDTMPWQWRNPLSHAIDVWLPCTYNVEVFTRALGRPAFRLPHALPTNGLNGVDRAAVRSEHLTLAETDFVFYSIFEWQDRKNPRGIIEAFLRAFPEECDAVLVIKSNPQQLGGATQLLNEIRAKSGSKGRVLLCCEAWTEAQIKALQDRGDCYISLHKGEGWAYPLFEAAAQATPVVATGYGGPADYLDAQHHWLVRHRPASVRQSYQYYHSGMSWAEPDISHASEGLRWVFEHRQEASTRAADAARKLKADYSIEQVGAIAYARLIDLLRKSNPGKAMSLQAKRLEQCRPKALPIPGDWFDADYFELGIKSNWQQGYTWPLFKGVFQEAADYLIEMFPEAQTFLDIGCAKGFLVKALRHKGVEAWGFDHSPWAISHSDDEAAPFIQLADVATVDYSRQFDVLVAMGVFHTLTEEQIGSFLSRARSWTRQALFATIVTLDPASGDQRRDDDRDASSVTLRDREWWRARLREAGWEQDHVHRLFERACQSHPLPTKMRWNVYVFSTGR